MFSVCTKLANSFLEMANKTKLNCHQIARVAAGVEDGSGGSYFDEGNFNSVNNGLS